MKKAVCFADRHFSLGEVDDKMFSSFTEHLGRCIYTGIYEPGHPTADENEDTELTLDLNGFGDRKIVKHLSLFGDDLDAINTIDDPDKVVVKEIEASGNSKALLPKLSFNVLVLK